MVALVSMPSELVWDRALTDVQTRYIRFRMAVMGRAFSKSSFQGRLLRCHLLGTELSN